MPRLALASLNPIVYGRKLEQRLRRWRKPLASSLKSLGLFRYARQLEQRLRRWRKRLPFALRDWRCDRMYAQFDVPAAMADCPRRPLYSIVVPVYKTEIKWLRLCIGSVLKQMYSHWELILVDDGSHSPLLTQELERWARKDARIRVFTQPMNQGISAATNFGLAQACGEFVCFLDHDDELTPDALLWMFKAHNANPRSRWFYSDEAVREVDGNYTGRFHYKPAYSWEYLLTIMYTCHFSVYARSLLTEIGGFRAGYDGAQDHDLALRASERTTADEVTHIPQVLYFWRAIPQSTASSLSAKPEAANAAECAVREAVKRRSLPCRVVQHEHINTMFRLILDPPRELPKVAVVIPTRNAEAMVRRCIESLLATTNYSNYEIVVIDNQSDQPELASYLQELGSRAPLRTFRYDRPFNHSDMHNQIIAKLDADWVVLVNNDVYNFASGWLEQLLATVLLDPSIGGAGGKLYYPDGTIQHAGVIVGVGEGLAGNVGCGESRESVGFLGRGHCLQQVSAVTGALMIVNRQAYLQVNGFDAERYPTSYNDVDLWVRLGEAGYRCLYNPEVHAVHEESKSRGVTEQEVEFQRRLREDLRRRDYCDRFWNVLLYDNQSRVRRDQETGAWVRKKLEALAA